MKNLLFTTLLVIVSILQLSANNAPGTSPIQVLKYEKALILDLSSLIAKANSFTVADSNGEIVFSKMLKKYDHAVKFQLENLSTGEYEIQIEGADFMEKYVALVTKEILSVERTESHFRPSVTMMDNKVLVDAFFDKDGDILITIFDAKSGDAVYDFRDQANGNYQKTFNLEQLKKGTYDVVVSTDYYNKSSKVTL